MALAISSSQSPLVSSIMPLSALAASLRSMGRAAVWGMPYCLAIASTWLSPKTAIFLPQSGHWT